ncbi:hypothetical protein OS493_002388 [Desmophyllum pertusum]|uniref:Uncharacterized protein n=1 Tax=Desmophyllum pertusum TaxID=174260 RepID=A0A9W9YSV1_9CNID|nr:hypothetical protein OS493_002388 [Desmophyllum pertusum]
MECDEDRDYVFCPHCDHVVSRSTFKRHERKRYSVGLVKESGQSRRKSETSSSSDDEGRVLEEPSVVHLVTEDYGAEEFFYSLSSNRRFVGIPHPRSVFWHEQERERCQRKSKALSIHSSLKNDPRDDNCGEANPVSDVPYDISHVVKSAEKLSDADKVQFLENCWRPTPSCSNLDTQYWKSGNLNKHIKFQIKWLDQRKWLAYSARPDHIGAWCITCCLFLSDNEKASLGLFVKTPFRTYNKSKEKFDGHETKEYHKKAVERSYVVRAQVSNIQKRIDTQIDSVRMDNIQSNKTVLPLIVDAVMLCASNKLLCVDTEIII